MRKARDNASGIAILKNKKERTVSDIARNWVLASANKNSGKSRRLKPNSHNRHSIQK